jgi:hypothetical protein
MPNPRKLVRFDEIHVQRATFLAGAGLTYDATKPNGTDLVGAPVKISADDTVTLCANGDKPFGFLDRIEADGVVSVAWHGFVEAKGTAAVGGDVLANTGNVVKAGAGAGVGTVVKVLTNSVIVKL